MGSIPDPRPAQASEGRVDTDRANASDPAILDDINVVITAIEAKLRKKRPIVTSVVPGPFGEKWLSFTKHAGKWRLMYDEKPLVECTIATRVKVAKDIFCLANLITKMNTDRSEAMREIAESAQRLRDFLDTME